MISNFIFFFGCLLIGYSVGVLLRSFFAVQSFDDVSGPPVAVDPWSPTCPQCFQVRPGLRNWQRCECGGMFVPFFIVPESGYTFRHLPSHLHTGPRDVDASLRIDSGRESF